MKSYELIEHTADVGIRVKSSDLKGLFQAAARAMFEIIAEKKPPSAIRQPPAQKNIIKQAAENKEELFINWLNELLSLSGAKGLIFSDFKINKLTETALESIAIGENIASYKVNTEIKAATYHQLKLEKTNAGWLAEVIFDV